MKIPYRRGTWESTKIRVPFDFPRTVSGRSKTIGEMFEEERQHALELPARTCQVVPAEVGESIGDAAALCVATGI